MSTNKIYPRARKRFGQNFLCDQSVIDDIITEIDAQPMQHIVEIGPGRGALTLPLLHLCKNLDVVELDRDLIPLLHADLKSFDNLNIHESNALYFDYRKLVKKQEKLRVIGSLPYNITTPLLFYLLEQSECIHDMLFVLQREVAERICAQPGSKRYGRLSIMVQHQCQTKLMFTISPEAFIPIPKVESAIVSLRPLIDRVGGYIDTDAFNKIVTQAFAQRRKTIANALRKMVSTDILVAAGCEEQQRPETVSVEQFVIVTRMWLEINRRLDK